MQYTAAALLSLSALASALPYQAGVPFRFPLTNGFPNPSPEALKVIEKNAGGTLPNGPLPTKLGPNGVLDFQIIAVNEIFEVAFFSSLLHNVTNDVPGFTDTTINKTEIMADLFQIRAQEEMHALGANAILKSAGHPEIQPCQYMFPSTSFAESVVLAETFTALVLGTLQTVQMQLALEGGAELNVLTPLIGSIVGQEGEQTGFYRYFQHKVPSAAPFLTVGAGQYAFNAINQMFIVPGSCPNSPDVPLYQPLMVVAQPPAMNSTVSFETPEAATTSSWITYISGQNSPVTVPVTSVTTKDGKNVVTADFPFDAGFSKGLTIAALSSKAGPFASVTDVIDATLAGPGLIVVE